MNFFYKKKNQEETEKKNRPESPGKKGDSLIERINNYFLQFSRIPLKEKLFFIQYFGIMFKTGISLSVIMRTLSKQTSNKYFAKVINDLGDRLEGGSSLADSFRVHERVFGTLFVNMIEAGEISGNLENVLKQLYIQTKKQSELRSKIKGALTYPVVLVLAMIIIGVFMMIFVVPQLTGMLRSFGTELPLPTKIMVNTSDFIVNNGILVGGVFLLIVLVFIQILRTYRGKYYFHKLILKLPIVSPIAKKINLAHFARTTSSLLKTDILIVKTFHITANVLKNLPYREAVEDMSKRIEKGGQINEIISEYPQLFPPVVQQIVLVGEETGELDNILLELADFYEKEVDNIMDNLPSIIEPILILLLGIGVGAMAIAIIMPMYSMTATI